MTKPRWVSFERFSDGDKVWIRADLVIAVIQVGDRVHLSTGNMDIAVRGELDLVQKVVEHGKEEQ